MSNEMASWRRGVISFDNEQWHIRCCVTRSARLRNAARACGHARRAISLRVPCCARRHTARSLAAALGKTARMISLAGLSGAVERGEYHAYRGHCMRQTRALPYALHCRKRGRERRLAVARAPRHGMFSTGRRNHGNMAWRRRRYLRLVLAAIGSAADTISRTCLINMPRAARYINVPLAPTTALALTPCAPLTGSAHTL